MSPPALESRSTSLWAPLKVLLLVSVPTARRGDTGASCDLARRSPAWQGDTLM